MKKLFICLIFLVTASSVTKAQNILYYNLEARMDGVDFLWNGDSLIFWGFADRNDTTTTSAVLPGPTIICEEGDSVVINLTNVSFEAHTIHLHGLDVDQLNDGVPSTSFFIQPGQKGVYSFKANYAGNFLYHCHVGTVLHLQMGMYGAVIVKAANGSNQAYTGGPSFDREFMWMTNEVDKSWHDDYTAIGDFSRYAPDFFHVNAKSRQQIWNDSAISIYNAYIGEVLLLRMMNMGYGINRYIIPPSLNPVIVSSDGRPLPNTLQNDTILVYPGERFSTLITPQSLITDSIRVEYLKMYRDQKWGEEKIPIQVNNLSQIKPKIQNNVRLYPNPTNNELSIGNFEGEYQILNNLGQVVHQGIVDRNRPIKLESMPIGVYIIYLVDRGGVQENLKFIKK